MNLYPYNDFTIVVVDEPEYKIGSPDNAFNDHKEYMDDNSGGYQPSSIHRIKVYQDGRITDSCIIMSPGGATCIHPGASLIYKQNILLCCGDTIFCLTIPDLNLKWKTQADPAACFQILRHQDEFIIHGELQVSRLDKNGNIIWNFSGADIFVSTDSNGDLKIENDGISISDFAHTKYKIGFDGKLIWSSYKG